MHGGESATIADVGAVPILNTSKPKGVLWLCFNTIGKYSTTDDRAYARLVNKRLPECIKAFGEVDYQAEYRMTKNDDDEANPIYYLRFKGNKHLVAYRYQVIYIDEEGNRKYQRTEKTIWLYLGS